MSNIDFLSVQIQPLIGLLAIFVVSFLLLVEIAHWQEPENGRSKVYRILLHAFVTGLRSGIRGYFALLTAAPWRAAWLAHRQNHTDWWSPLTAWMNTVEKITFGSTEDPSQESKPEATGCSRK